MRSVFAAFVDRRAVASFFLLLLLCGNANCYGFELNGRWSTTAVNGGGLQQGDPTTITWGFIADGTNIPNIGGSDFIEQFDLRFGAGPGGSDLTQRPWFTYFQQSFDRYEELSGLSYIYEPNDDGVEHSTSPGVLGVRPDVRIGGGFYDGPSNVLAYNFFPDNGDMMIDTADMGAYGSPSNNFRFLRNVVMHEHGHGTGFGHSESSNAELLMEPFINTAFDGPSVEDIRGIHRGYGDFYEKSNDGQGNETAALATDLGVIAPGSSVDIGRNAVGDNRIFGTLTDLVSIDDNSDTDFYSFTVDGPTSVDVVLKPAGPPILSIGPQNGTESIIDTTTMSNLTVAIVATDQTTELAFDNSGSFGEIDELVGVTLPAAGEYFIRVNGLQNDVQLYRLDVFNNSFAGDFDNDGLFSCNDIDALVGEVATGSSDPQFDLDGSGAVDVDDVSSWLAIAGGANLPSGNAFNPGDANLDGDVNGADFLIWQGNNFSEASGWCQGDFSADGFVNGTDFLVWNDFKFTSADVSAVPEPVLMWLLPLFGIGLLRRRRR